jgi:hypothetical protein
MKAKIVVQCFATIEETWEVEVPETMTADELDDIALDLIDSAKAEFLSERSLGMEHDRRLISAVKDT